MGFSHTRRKLIFEFLIAEFDCAGFAHYLAYAEGYCRRENEQTKHYAHAELPVGYHALRCVNRAEYAHKTARTHSAARSTAVNLKNASGKRPE